jgi:hypothetical protein
MVILQIQIQTKECSRLWSGEDSWVVAVRLKYFQCIRQKWRFSLPLLLSRFHASMLQTFEVVGVWILTVGVTSRRGWRLDTLPDTQPRSWTQDSNRGRENLHFCRIHWKYLSLTATTQLSSPLHSLEHSFVWICICKITIWTRDDNGCWIWQQIASNELYIN